MNSSLHDLQGSFLRLVEENKRIESAHLRLHTEFLLLKEELKSSLKALESIVFHMEEGLIFLNLEGRVTLYNPQAELLTSVPYHILYQKLFWDYFPDNFFGFSMRASLQSPTSNRTLLTLGGRELEISSSLIPHQGLLLLIRDRTEIESLERALQHNERLKEIGQMAATLAHEIRNPLGGIEGFASLLKRDLKDPKQLEMAGAIVMGAQALNRLVTQVLDYARPLSLHFAPCDFVELVHESLKIAANYIPSFPCTFHSHYPSYTLSIDRERILLVLLNLLKNAFDASPPSGTITLLLNEKGVLSISDQGEGIAVEDREKLFTPFFTTKTKGTGLGLAEALKVVQAHGGELSFNSSPGETIFSLFLP